MAYLYHHGILGQKWGRRNGPPYPLGASDHSASERKAGWRSSLKGRTTPNKQRHKKIGPDTLAGEIDPELIELGVSAIASIVATVSYVGIIRSLANKAFKDEIQKNKDNNTSNIKKKIKGSHSETQDMEKVNPDYKIGKPENLMNCTMCTTAYEMRRRGYDVQANVTKIGRKMSDVCSWFDIPKNEVYKTRDYSDIKKKLESEPEGSRGNIFSGVGSFDSYHSMIWEKKNGKVVIRDSQSNEEYKSIDSSIINKKSIQTYQYVRTDDKSVNWDNIKDAIVERED